MRCAFVLSTNGQSKFKGFDRFLELLVVAAQPNFNAEYPDELPLRLFLRGAEQMDGLLTESFIAVIDDGLNFFFGYWYTKYERLRFGIIAGEGAKR